MNKIKQCKDCKWSSLFDLVEDIEYANCLCPKSKDVQRAMAERRVLGSKKETDHHDGISCSFHRNRNWIESLFAGPFCTKSGKWFEEKTEK